MKQTLREASLILKLYTRGQGFEIKNEDKRGFRIIGVLIILLVMIPCCLGAGLITYVMTLAFLEAGGGTEGLLFVIQFLSAFALVFGLGVVMNEFYYSSDLNFLLPLPVKPGSIISAKFLITYVAESGMEFLIIISAWAGYLAAVKPSVSGVILCILSTFTLPLMPLVYCGILGMLTMFLFKGVGNKKALNVFMTLLSLVFLAGAVFSFGGLKGLSIENFVEMLVNNENTFMNIMNMIFFPSYLLIKGIGGSMAGVLAYFALTLIGILVFIMLANRIYLPGLYAFRSAGNPGSRKMKKGISGQLRRRSAGFALFKKELLVLIRTKGFVTNCLLINIFWPVTVITVLLMQSGNTTIGRFMFTYHYGYVMAKITMIAVFLGLAAVTTAANSLASSVVTREGKHASYMKYIPVSYSTQLHVKGGVSILISFLSYLADVIIIGRVFLLSLRDMGYYLIIGLCMIVFITCLGVMLDTKNPKLVWENESNALRANMNVFVNMAAAMLSALVIIGLGFILYFIRSTTNLYITWFYMVLMLIAALGSYAWCSERAVKNLENLEP